MSKPELRPTDQSRVIVARAVYDETVRFGLWKLIADDIRIVGCGYRQYYNVMIAELIQARKQGWRIQHQNGNNIVFECLASDDLYGFLGKNKNRPTGPSRRLSLDKMKVLDCYMYLKYPRLSRSYDGQRNVHELAMMNIELLHGESPDMERWTKLLSTMGGIYLAIDGFVDGFNHHGHVIFGAHNIIGFSLHPAKNCPYMTAHFFIIPNHPSYIKKDSSIFKQINWEKVSTLNSNHPGASVLSGIGFPFCSVDLDGVGLFSLLLMLSDRATKDNFVTDLWPNGYAPVGEQEEYLCTSVNFRDIVEGENFLRIFKEGDTASYEHFSSKLCKWALRFHDKLGMGF
jgi:hypothetical protein